MAKGRPGADSSVLATNQIQGQNLIQPAIDLFGQAPAFWGRYFTSASTSGSVEYRHLKENPILRQNNIRVLPMNFLLAGAKAPRQRRRNGRKRPMAASGDRGESAGATTFSAAVTASTPVTPGIDVSHHQGQVNWYLVAEAGVSFAFAKATEGVTFVDPEFSTNWIGIKNAGIIRGPYHFFRPAKPVDAQVDNFTRTVSEINDGDLPPVLDLEEARTPSGDEWDDIPGDERVPLVLHWLKGVEAKLGRRPIVYTRRSFVAAELPNAAPLGQYLLWVAHYTSKPAPSLPSPWTNWTFWQYSAAGTINGIEGPADLDRFNGSLSDLEMLTKTISSTNG